MGAGQQTIPFTIFESTGLLTMLVLPIKSSVTSKGWGKKEIVKTVNESLTNTDLQGFKSPATEIAI